MRSGAAAAIIAGMTVSASAAPARLFAGGSWAAIDRGHLCEAGGRAERIAAKGKVQAIASFVFTPDRKRWGEFHARLSRPVRPQSTVILSIGGRPFLLVGGGDRAWSRGTAQQDAIIEAVRMNGRMSIEARDSGGRRFRDPYRLDGAPTAIDAAAARCAGKTG